MSIIFKLDDTFLECLILLNIVLLITSEIHYLIISQNEVTVYYACHLHHACSKHFYCCQLLYLGSLSALYRQMSEFVKVLIDFQKNVVHAIICFCLE